MRFLAVRGFRRAVARSLAGLFQDRQSPLMNLVHPSLYLPDQIALTQMNVSLCCLYTLVSCKGRDFVEVPA